MDIIGEESKVSSSHFNYFVGVKKENKHEQQIVSNIYSTERNSLWRENSRHNTCEKVCATTARGARVWQVEHYQGR